MLILHGLYPDPFGSGRGQGGGENHRKLKLFGVAFALAAGAFVLTTLKDPPKSVASDPTAPVAKTVDLRVPTGIPSADDCLTASICP